jgi:phosphoglycolate phosphatase
MESTRHIVFDLDGTLVDSLPGIEWSVGQALSICGLPPLEESLRSWIGPPIRSILGAISMVSDPPLLDRLEQAFRQSYDTVGWRKTVCYEGVRDMLWGLLTSGVGLYLVTNKPFKPTHRILRQLKLDAFFQEIVASDSRLPPYVSKAEALAELLQRHGLAPDQSLMVGDTRDDVAAAAAAGIRCAIVDHGYGGVDFHPGRISFRNLFEEAVTV